MVQGRAGTDRSRIGLGRYGEEVAARYLRDHGLTILERNWRCDLGELDIVAREGDVLVVCEVKTRTSSSFGTPQEAVTRRKLARLRRLAARWVAERGVRVPEVRLDLVGVRLDRSGDARFEHARGVG